MLVIEIIVDFPLIIFIVDIPGRFPDSKYGTNINPPVPEQVHNDLHFLTLTQPIIETMDFFTDCDETHKPCALIKKQPRHLLNENVTLFGTLKGMPPFKRNILISEVPYELLEVFDVHLFHKTATVKVRLGGKGGRELVFSRHQLVEEKKIAKQ